MDLKDNIAIATARRLAGLGGPLALVDLTAPGMSALADETGALALICNVADAAASETALSRVLSERGRPHLLVNCAGIAPGARIVEKEGPGSLAAFERRWNHVAVPPGRIALSTARPTAPSDVSAAWPSDEPEDVAFVRPSMSRSVTVCREMIACGALPGALLEVFAGRSAERAAEHG